MKRARSRTSINRTTRRYTVAGRRTPRAGFTLIELIIVIGIIVVLIGITVFAVGAATRSAQLASASNTVKAALGRARALAIRNRYPVGVIFRVKWDPNQPDFAPLTEVVTIKWTRYTILIPTIGVIDRYVREPSVEPAYLSAGIKVAGRFAEAIEVVGEPTLWVSQPNLQRADPLIAAEAGSALFGVLFGADGSLITHGPESDSDEPWFDLDQEGWETGSWLPDFGNTPGNTRYRLRTYDEPNDEPSIRWVPVLAIYDDDEAREIYEDSDWDDAATRNDELRQYLESRADLIYFNRYTGVVVR